MHLNDQAVVLFYFYIGRVSSDCSLFVLYPLLNVLYITPELENLVEEKKHMKRLWLGI